MVKFILQQSLNPYFNIASEEYLLRSFSDDFIYIYRCNPSIVVGKHQNTFAEVNLRLVERLSIRVVRRLSWWNRVSRFRQIKLLLYFEWGPLGSW